MKYKTKKRLQMFCCHLIVLCLTSCSTENVSKTPPEPLAKRTITCFNQCCIEDSDSIKPLPHQNLKVKLGQIGVACSYYRPGIIFQTPLSKGEAALRGASSGFMYFFPEGKCPYFFMGGWECVGAILLSPVGAIVGGFSEGAKGEKLENNQELEEMLKSYLASINLQYTLWERVLAINNEKYRYPIVLLDKLGPHSMDEKINYDFNLLPEIDTILEIGITRVDLGGDINEVNPEICLYMKAKAKLIRRSTGEVTYKFTVYYDKGNKYKFKAWSDENGRLYKEEVDRALNFLAQKIVEVMCIIQNQPNTQTPSIP